VDKKTGWSRASVAVLGGDARELEIARSFLAAGCTVRTYGTMPDERYDQWAASSAVEAVTGADIIVAPVPGVGPNDTLYAPHAPLPVQITAQVFAAARPGAFYFSGRARPTMMEAGAPFGIRFRHLADDEYMLVMHSIPTAEGAIAITVRETDGTILGAEALVTGFGRIGSQLARGLHGLGAHVTIAARRPEVRVRALAEGYATCDTAEPELAAALARADLVYNTIPAKLLTRDLLGHICPGTLVMDLASPPGGVDIDGAEELGLKAIWARGQAGTAPRHSGHAQYEVMARILDAEFGAND
jgi:dipicolinate synthase subunit A